MTRPKTKKIPTAHEKKNASHFIQNNTLLKNVKMFYQFSKCKLIISTNIKHDFYKNKSQTLHMTNFIKILNFFQWTQNFKNIHNVPYPK